MTTLYLVVSPNGKLAYVGTDAAQAEFYRPTTDYSSAYPVNEGYSAYAVEAGEPWLEVNNELPA